MLKKNDSIIQDNTFFPCIYLTYVCTYVYHESARTYYVYMYFHIFLVIFGIGNDYIILFIYHIKV